MLIIFSFLRSLNLHRKHMHVNCQDLVLSSNVAVLPNEMPLCQSTGVHCHCVCSTKTCMASTATICKAVEMCTHTMCYHIIDDAVY